MAADRLHIFPYFHIFLDPPASSLRFTGWNEPDVLRLLPRPATSSRCVNSWAVLAPSGLAVRCTAIFFGFLMNALQVTAADPAYDSNGELIDGGDDLTMGGTCEYFHDGIYLAAFVQILSPFLSDWLWLVFLVVSWPAFHQAFHQALSLHWVLFDVMLCCSVQIPGYGTWLLWTNILQPYFSSSTAQVSPPHMTCMDL